MPAAPGANDADVAIPPLNVMALPTGLPPPLVQPLVVVNGPQTKKFTVPVGAGPPGLPATVAWSVFEIPRTSV